MDREKTAVTVRILTRGDVEDRIWEASGQNEKLSADFLDALANRAFELLRADAPLALHRDAVNERVAQIVDAVIAGYPDLKTMTSEDYDAAQYRTFTLMENGVPREVTGASYAPLPGASPAAPGAGRPGATP